MNNKKFKIWTTIIILVFLVILTLIFAGKPQTGTDNTDTDQTTDTTSQQN